MSQENTVRLGRDFFARPTLKVARELLGCRLVRLEEGRRLSGWITETEAYVGEIDLGCHARSGRTLRNRSMWGPPGHAYVYFTYGMHWLLNVVTERNDFPAAVLIRAIVPVEGLSTMQERRPPSRPEKLAGGPAKLCQALALGPEFDGHDLCSEQSKLFIEPGRSLPEKLIATGPRVGLYSVPEPWKSVAWRFRIASGVLEGI